MKNQFEHIENVVKQINKDNFLKDGKKMFNVSDLCTGKYYEIRGTTKNNDGEYFGSIGTNDNKEWYVTHYTMVSSQTYEQPEDWDDIEDEKTYESFTEALMAFITYDLKNYLDLAFEYEKIKDMENEMDEELKNMGLK